MRWPADRRFTDGQGKIVDPWLGPMKALEPLLGYTPQQFVALQALIAAYIASQNEIAEGGSADPLELPINTEPLLSEDYFIGWKNNLAAGRRFPMSLFSAQLISSTSLAGAGSHLLSVPSGYSHLRLALLGASLDGSGFTQIALSENGGSTRLAASYKLFNDTLIQAVTTAATLPKLLDTVANSVVYSSIVDIHGVSTELNKVARIDTVYDSSGECITGTMVFASTLPINTIELVANSTNLYDSGTAELWGFR